MFFIRPIHFHNIEQQRWRDVGEALRLIERVSSSWVRGRVRVRIRGRVRVRIWVRARARVRVRVKARVRIRAIPKVTQVTRPG